MDNIVKSISDIENHAKKIIEDANNECETLRSDYEAQRNEAIKLLEKEADAQIEEAKAKELQIANEKIAEIDKKAKNTISALKDDYANNKDEYSKQVFEKVIEY